MLFSCLHLSSSLSRGLLFCKDCFAILVDLSSLLSHTKQCTVFIVNICSKVDHSGRLRFTATLLSHAVITVTHVWQFTNFDQSLSLTNHLTAQPDLRNIECSLVICKNFLQSIWADMLLSFLFNFFYKFSVLMQKYDKLFLLLASKTGSYYIILLSVQTWKRAAV